MGQKQSFYNSDQPSEQFTAFLLKLSILSYNSVQFETYSKHICLSSIACSQIHLIALAIATCLLTH